MTTTSPAPNFMVQLAANDKSTRDGAVDKLRIYLRSRSQFSELELMKLWKGLFYCMWMSDKPRNQQQLARDLAGLIEVVPKDTVIPFLDTFWKTMAREWGGIPQLRMDKYLYLVRQYLHGSFQYLARLDWKDTTAIDEFMAVMRDTPLNVEDKRIPNGMRYHIIDIYVDEMEKVSREFEGEIPAEQLLAPLVSLQKESHTRAVKERAKEALEDERVREWLGLGPVEKQQDEEAGGWGGFED